MSDKQFWKRAAEAAGKYFDDLLITASGTCLTLAAGLAFGAAAALTAAGICLGIYAAVVARARRGG